MDFCFLSSHLLWNWGLPCLSAPAPLLLDLGCLRPNLADQSIRPRFSRTIFWTRSKLESQVALPDSIFPKTTACTCNNLGHSMYCDLYAVVFNISSRRQASLSDKLPHDNLNFPSYKQTKGQFLEVSLLPTPSPQVLRLQGSMWVFLLVYNCLHLLILGAARDDPQDWRRPLASDADVSSSICCSCMALDARSLAISSLRSCINTRHCSCSLASSASSASSSVGSSSSVVIYCEGSSDKS